MKTRTYNSHYEGQKKLGEASHNFKNIDGLPQSLRSFVMTNKRERGNAMIYVLVALALFGFLTMTLSRSGDQADGQDISDEQAEFYAQELMQYAASAQQAVDMMIISGTNIDELDFVTPDDAAFNTPPHIHKVFHPQGGGLNYKAKFNKNIETETDGGWYARPGKNVEWTTSTNNDVTLTAWRIKREVCERINQKIIRSSTIPQMTTGHHDVFVTMVDTLDTTSCPDCEGKTSLCTLNSAGTHYAYYNIIAAQ